MDASSSTSGPSNTLSRTNESRLNARNPDESPTSAAASPRVGRSGPVNSVIPESTVGKIVPRRQQGSGVSTFSQSTAKSSGLGRGIRRTVTTTASISENATSGVGYSTDDLLARGSGLAAPTSEARRGILRHNSLTSGTIPSSSSRTRRAADAATSLASSSLPHQIETTPAQEHCPATATALRCSTIMRPKTDGHHCNVNQSSRKGKGKGISVDVPHGKAAWSPPTATKVQGRLPLNLQAPSSKYEATERASAGGSEEDFGAKLQELFANPPAIQSEAELNQLTEDDREKVLDIQDLVWKLYLLEVQNVYNKSIAQQEAALKEHLARYESLRDEVQGLRSQAEARRHQELLHAFSESAGVGNSRLELIMSKAALVGSSTTELKALVHKAAELQKQAQFLVDLLASLR